MIAHAKLNLVLNVKGLLPNGYHELEMITTPISLADEVVVESSDEFSFTCSDPSLENADNTAVKAFREMQNEAWCADNARISIEKKIPVAAGLGGGSADAAAVIRSLNGLWNLNWSREKLFGIGARVGSDVPVCIADALCYAGGRGEKVKVLDEKPMPLELVLVKPGVELPANKTALLFKKLDNTPDHVTPEPEKLLEALRYRDRHGFVHSLGNSFDSIQIPEYEVVHQARKDLLEEGAEVAMTAGSGPTVFGVFEDKTRAEKAFHSLSKKYNNRWIAKTI